MADKSKKINIDVRSYTMIFALIAIWIIFTALTGGGFLTPRNLSNLIRQMSITAILAVGMVLVMVAGHIDLSVGSVAGFTGALAAIMQVNYGWSTPVTIIITLAAGLLIGLWQGFWIAFQGVPAFITTLSSMLVFRGAILLVTKGVTISPLSDSFKTIGQGYISPAISIVLGVVAGIAYLIF